MTLAPDQIAELRRLLDAATGGEWVWTLTSQSSRKDVLRYLQEHCDRSPEGPLHGVGVPAPGCTIEEHCLVTAISGNGPASEANAQLIAALRNNAKALLDAAERDQDRKQREPDMWTEYRSANVMRGNQRLHDENTALRAEVQMLKAQVDVEHREKVETYTQNQNLKECIEGLKEHVEGLSDYIDKAKIEAQRLGRVSGEPLYEFLRRLQ